MVTASQRRGDWRAHRAVAWVLGLAVVPLASFGSAWLLLLRVALRHLRRPGLDGSARLARAPSL